MKMIVDVQLDLTYEQRNALLRTLEHANAAANRLSQAAWETGTFGQYALHKLAYHDTKDATGLTAQMVVRLIAKVADAYKLDRNRQRFFRSHGSIAYDDRIVHWYTSKGEVSIWTVDGRLTIPYRCGDRQRTLLAMRQGESDLVYRDGRFYLYATVNYIEPPTGEPDAFLGVDLGLVNLATDSDGTVYTGTDVERVRRTYAHRRRNLQRKGTRSAKRKLKAIAGKQARYQQSTNHVISKQIVTTAEDTQRGIGLENLTGLSARTTVRKRQRARHSNWAYRQIREYIHYKARMRGLRVVDLDPRYTSQRCAVCGHTARANRQSQSSFLCVACGHAGLADHNAARNLAFLARASVMVPNGGFAPKVLGMSSLGTSPLL